MPDLLTAERLASLRHYYTHVHTDPGVLSALDHIDAQAAEIEKASAANLYLSEELSRSHVEHMTACAENEALHAFALRCQRAHATPGCEREPLQVAYLDLLARRIEQTADKREALEWRVERLERVMAAEQGREGLDGWVWSGARWNKPGRNLWIDVNPVYVGGKPRVWDWSADDYGIEVESETTYQSALEAMEAAEAAMVKP